MGFRRCSREESTFAVSPFPGDTVGGRAPPPAAGTPGERERRVCGRELGFGVPHLSPLPRAPVQSWRLRRLQGRHARAPWWPLPERRFHNLSISPQASPGWISSPCQTLESPPIRFPIFWIQQKYTLEDEREKVTRKPNRLLKMWQLFIYYSLQIR